MCFMGEEKSFNSNENIMYVLGKIDIFFHFCERMQSGCQIFSEV